MHRYYFFQTSITIISFYNHHQVNDNSSRCNQLNNKKGPQKTIIFTGHRECLLLLAKRNALELDVKLTTLDVLEAERDVMLDATVGQRDCAVLNERVVFCCQPPPELGCVGDYRVFACLCGGHQRLDV